MGLHLTAKSSIQVLDSYNGVPGFYIKTFGLNTLRNKNGWRVSWESIDKRIQEFADQNLPGILYNKCIGSICDLDHTDGQTYKSSLQAQEPYRVTDIIDTVKNPQDESADVIHRIAEPVDDVHQEMLEQFKQDISDGKIQFVSPSVWPLSGQYDIKKGEYMPNGEPIVDAYDWLPLHIAFVNDPAFGDVARVKATCDGDDCHVRLLTAKQLQAYNENHDDQGRFSSADSSNDSNSSPPPNDQQKLKAFRDYLVNTRGLVWAKTATIDELKKTRLSMIQNKIIDHSFFGKQLNATPTFETQKVIFRMTGSHEGPDECDDYADNEYDINDPDRPQVPVHYNCLCTYEDKQTGEDLGQLDSKTLHAKAISQEPPVILRHKDHLVFVSATKSMVHDIDDMIHGNGHIIPEQLPSIFKNNSFSACTCSTGYMAQTPEQEIASLKASLKAAEDGKKDAEEKVKKLESASKDACAKCGSTDHMTDNHTKENSANNDDDNDDSGSKDAKTLKARLVEAEKEISQPMVVEMLKARTELGMPEDEIKNFEKSLSAKSLAEIKQIYNGESILLKAALVKTETTDNEFHAPFNGATEGGSLNGKTLEQIAGETS